VGLFKTTAIALGMAIAAPGAAAYRLTGSLSVFRGFGEAYSMLPGLPGRYVRAAYYHLTLARCPLNLNIGIFSKFNHPDSMVGESVMIGAYCSIGLVTLGDHAGCAERSSVLSRTPQHNFSDPSKLVLSETHAPSRVTIGYDAHVGAGCVVLANIGSKTIIGPGSVVANDIDDNCIAVGNPARVVKKRESA
jgi:acetyltransferase-like isoleucine patch superfamily enzyme